jgi:hypothetical protein
MGGAVSDDTEIHTITEHIRLIASNCFDLRAFERLAWALWLSFPKILSERVMVVQPQQDRDADNGTGALDRPTRGASLSNPSGCGPHCNTPHKQKEFATRARHQRPAVTSEGVWARAQHRLKYKEQLFRRTIARRKAKGRRGNVTRMRLH